MSHGPITTHASDHAAAPPPGEIIQTAVSMTVFNALLNTDGIRAARYALLRQSDYRVIGILRFKEGEARSVVHVDRQSLGGERRRLGHDGLLLVRSQERGAFLYHPRLHRSSFLGTLCHYDLEPRDPEQLDLQLLRQVGNVLGRSGLVPEYPAAKQP